jgi:hypothetical protein
MARRGWKAALAALGLAAALTACSGRIWVDQEGPQTIRLHWYTSEASIGEATAKADRHCQDEDNRRCCSKNSPTRT